MQRKIITPASISAIICLLYTAAFVYGIADRWFSPYWTNDDATQQLFPFYQAISPDAFKDDLIYTQMRAYLPSVHYALGWTLMHIIANPVMVGHYIMLIQLSLSILFILAGVRHAAGTAPAFFAVVWFLHSRHIVERITGGLPRGWAPVLLCAYLYFALKGRHRCILLLSLLGWFIQPVATFLMLMSYGLLLLSRLYSRSSRRDALRPCLELAFLLPVLALCAILGTRMPEEIGQMRTLSEASVMPEFQRPHGRFPMLPFYKPWREIKKVAFQAFVDRWHRPARIFRKALPYAALGLLAFIAAVSWRQRRELIPLPVCCFGAAAIITYFLSRMFAFRLYVPDRHLQIPLALFFIFAFTISFWLLPSKHTTDSAAHPQEQWRSFLALSLLAFFISIGSGLGLKGDLSFNYRLDQRSPVFNYFKEHSPQNALIAGDPQFLDPLPLLSARRAYATLETAHPFYNRYYAVIKPRFDRALRATYAESLTELQDIFDEEPSYQPDYMLFPHKLFEVNALKRLGKDKVRASLLGTRFAQRAAANKEDFIYYRDAELTVIDLRRIPQH